MECINGISEEDKEVLKNCYVITTDHALDDENMKLRRAINNILDNCMTPKEKSLWGYEHYLKHKQYNDDLDWNIDLLINWAKALKGMGNANYPYVYAIERVVREIKKGDAKDE